MNPEIRRFRRLLWLLIPLWLLSLPLLRLARETPSPRFLTPLEFVFFAFSVFLFSALIYNLVRLSPESWQKKFRLIFVALLLLLATVMDIPHELRFLIYFFLCGWILGYEACTALAGKEKLKLALPCFLGLFLLGMLPAETISSVSGDASSSHQVMILMGLGPWAGKLYGSLRHLLLAAVLVLPGKLLLSPIAQWLKYSLRIRTKLVLSYLLSSVLPGLLIVVMLFFGILFLLGSFYQRFIEQAIVARASTLALLVDQDSTTFARRLHEHSAAALRFKLGPRGELGAPSLDGFPFPARLQPDTVLVHLAQDRFSGLAVVEDSVYLTHWLAQDGGVIALFQPFRQNDLQQLKTQCGVPVVLLPKEEVITDTTAGRYGLITQLDSTQTSAMINSEAAGDTSTGWKLTGLPVLLPSLRLGQNGEVRSEKLLAIVQLSFGGIFGNLLSRDYVINRFYVIAFIVLTVILGAILVLVAMLGFGLAGGITRSVARLRRGTQALRQGDLSVRIAVDSKDELGELGDSFNQMVGDLNRMLVEIKEKERLEGELEAARSIQMMLLPQELPQIAGYDVAAASLSAKQVGGDYYDFLRLDSNWVSFLVGDVSGKGMPAALLMANLQASLHTLTELHHSPRELVGRLNRVLHANTPPEMFATFFFGLLDAGVGRLRYINAGHNYPLLCGDGRVEQLDIGGLPLGIMPQAEFAEGVVEIRRGEMIALYSDGIVEAMDSQDQEFGEARLTRLLQVHCGQAAQEILQTVVSDVQAFAGTPQDDVTLMIIKRL